MMKTPLTLDKLLDRAVSLFGDRELVTKQGDESVHRYTYTDAADRICQLAGALDELGVSADGRVATVAMNNYRHFELYFGPARSGRSMHMCNMRLPDEHFQYIINDAADEVLFVDPGLIENVETNAHALETVEQYVVLGERVPETDLDPVIAYEDLLDGQSTEYDPPPLDEHRECGMCYTSGTTGKPKGVAYSHRGIYLHSLMSGHVDTNGISERDSVLPVVPMFHANGWGIPYAATFVGAKQVFPGVHTDPASIARLIDEEEVTFSAAVPTVWLEMAEYLDDHPEVNISNIDRLTVGGSAPPESLIRRYDETYNAPIIQGWGMTETTPLGTMSTLRKEIAERPPDERYRYRATAGLPVAGVELRIRDESGEIVPRDGETMGEIEVRGPWIADEYHDRPEANERGFTEDVPASEIVRETSRVSRDVAGTSQRSCCERDRRSRNDEGASLPRTTNEGTEERSSSGRWLKTGDIATQDEMGYVDIVDRTKDVIKSGGEWISSVDLENELMAHDAVAEATVIAVPHEKWRERPLACVLTREGIDGGIELTAADLREHLGGRFPDWWLPDEVAFVEAIPRTSTGKFDKMALRKRFADDLP